MMRAGPGRPGAPLAVRRAHLWRSAGRISGGPPGASLAARRAHLWRPARCISGGPPGTSLAARRAHLWRPAGRISGGPPGASMAAPQPPSQGGWWEKVCVVHPGQNKGYGGFSQCLLIKRECRAPVRSRLN
jgi:hypothetical protein